MHEVKKSIKKFNFQSEDIKNKIYTSDLEISHHQFELEKLRHQYKSNKKEKKELTNLNFQWEKSVKLLEDENCQLESQVADTVDKISSIKEIIVKKRTESLPSILFERKIEDLAVFSDMQHVSKSQNLQIVHDPVLSFEKKPNLLQNMKIVIVASEKIYFNNNAIQIKENNKLKKFEFENVIQKDDMSKEIAFVIENILSGINGCIINYSSINRENILKEIVESCIFHIESTNIKFSCIEIIGDTHKSLLPNSSSYININLAPDIMIIFSESLQKLSKGKHHILLTFYINSTVLQILDIALLNLHQNQAEGLSINSSLLYLEEFLINLSTKNSLDFNKSPITKNLELSLSNNYFSCVLLHCEDFTNIDSITFGARIQQLPKKKYHNAEIAKSLHLLEKERNNNLTIMRCIEKTRKDISVYTNTIKEKEAYIAELNKKLKNSTSQKNITNSLSPNHLKPPSSSKILKPKTLIKDKDMLIILSQSE